MKNIFIVPVLAFAALLVAPSSSYALSCIDPDGMIEHIVSTPDYVVVTATPTENKEHIKEKAIKDDPNKSYDSGYTGQLLDISKAHMGTTPDSQWVYFRRDGTWNYLCAGAPAKVGTENIYVLSVPGNAFDLTTVVAVYPTDSEVAKDLLKEIADAKEIVEPAVYEVSASDWMTRLHDELKDMAFLIKVKLAEWNFWKTAK
jgi:hypothetical protein